MYDYFGYDKRSPAFDCHVVNRRNGKNTRNTKWLLAILGGGIEELEMPGW